MSAIRTGDELANLLVRAKEIETAFENLSQWEAYVDVKEEEFRQILFRLISESQEHKNIVKSLISKTNISHDPTPIPLTPRLFDLRNKHELEVMGQIGKYEKLAFDLYKSIYEALKRSDVRRLLRDENDAEDFMSSLEKLILDEREHMDLAIKPAGRTQRIV